ncbi:CRISPR-associated protein Cas5, subtype I-C/DVULG [Sphaerochaeta pleomorpha str. Grapes]|uniref:pre-crRNA processing endonuclease n=1 Tax=Sphaerochaeta pleomorpha (strain ATCC BAA-1885 / DSM 22778 / Grapes) TaxID=158190 RepID=G8QQN4_SPHPG|nr:type I-C CRISPR-associated protein Cas5c [Sphaerochaeta pleomorpha]AEV30964.1 CRISPR-associated protein Cas5, subtype I-C/DVULG [Sphaerochaeta pleomorpha str. Grapes]
MDDWILEVWGDYACFTRPEMKVERVSYDVITPSAARAIFEAIFWKPAIVWHITKIEVLNPIKWVSVRRNEIGKIASMPSKSQMEGTVEEMPEIIIEENRQQRASMILCDVHYRIHAYFEYLPPEVRNTTSSESEDDRTDESPAKYAAMFDRRARKGQYFHHPYLGCREFACYFSLIDSSTSSQGKKPIATDQDLGWMLYDMDFSKNDFPTPTFFKARMVQGCIDTDARTLEVLS